MPTTSKNPKPPARRPTTSARRTTTERLREREKDDRIAEVRATAVNTSTMAMAALVPEDKALTGMQKLFVKFWAEGDTIANAMKRAGYNDQISYGMRMAKMPNIIRAYNEHKAAYAEASQMSKKKVIDMLMEAYDMGRTMAEPSTMVSAAREIGRMCGFYEPVKHKVDVTVGVAQMESMSDADLFRVIEEAKKLEIQAQAGDFELLDGLDASEAAGTP